MQRFEISNRFPEGLFHGFVAGWKELEGNGYRSLTGHGIPGSLRFQKRG
jgi:hypothetical protein